MVFFNSGIESSVSFMLNRDYEEAVITKLSVSTPLFPLTFVRAEKSVNALLHLVDCPLILPLPACPACTMSKSPCDGFCFLDRLGPPASIVRFFIHSCGSFHRWTAFGCSLSVNLLIFTHRFIWVSVLTLNDRLQIHKALSHDCSKYNCHVSCTDSSGPISETPNDVLIAVAILTMEFQNVRSLDTVAYEMSVDEVVCIDCKVVMWFEVTRNTKHSYWAISKEDRSIFYSFLRMDIRVVSCPEFSIVDILCLTIHAACEKCNLK